MNKKVYTQKEKLLICIDYVNMLITEEEYAKSQKQLYINGLKEANNSDVAKVKKLVKEDDDSTSFFKSQADSIESTASEHLMHHFAILESINEGIKNKRLFVQTLESLVVIMQRRKENRNHEPVIQNSELDEAMKKLSLNIHIVHDALNEVNNQ